MIQNANIIQNRGRGIYEAIDKCFNSSSRSKEKAIENAHYQRDLKNAVKAVKENKGDVEEIRQALNKKSSYQPKQLSWASLKFASPTPDDHKEEGEDT